MAIQFFGGYLRPSLERPRHAGAVVDGLARVFHVAAGLLPEEEASRDVA